MFPMDRKPVPVAVEYDRAGVRVRKTFADPFAARRFYSAKLRNGKRPRVVALQETLPMAKAAKQTTAETTQTDAPKAKADGLTTGAVFASVPVPTDPIPAPKAKKTAKPVQAEKAEKAEPKQEATGLSAPRVRILAVLAKVNSLPGNALAEKAEVHPTSIGNLAGYRKAEINERECHAGNLLNRGYVKLIDGERDGRVTVEYAITAAGKKALERATKA